jgi:lipid A 3-O-deacylase
MRALTLAVVIQLTMAPPAIAQELARRVQFSVDNDYFNFWIPPRQRTDDNYTQGMRLRVDLARNPRFIRPLSCPSGAACSSTIEIGQDIYNPRFDSPFPVRGDRPYAGWLYARLAANGGDRRFLRVIEATAGITGKVSLAEKAQLALHGSVEGFRTPLGWAHQLPHEVSLGIAASQFFRVIPLAERSRILDVIPSVRGDLGTLRTGASAAVRARVGHQLDHPWLQSERRPFAVQAFVGVRGDGVARDLFLNGTAFRDSVRVDDRPWRGQWERGVKIALYRFMVEYRAVTTSREYEFGPPSHTYSTIALSWTR